QIRFLTRGRSAAKDVQTSRDQSLLDFQQLLVQCEHFRVALIVQIISHGFHGLAGAIFTNQARRIPARRRVSSADSNSFCVSTTTTRAFVLVSATVSSRSSDSIFTCRYARKFRPPRLSGTLERPSVNSNTTVSPNLFRTSSNNSIVVTNPNPSGVLPPMRNESSTRRARRILRDGGKSTFAVVP